MATTLPWLPPQNIFTKKNTTNSLDADHDKYTSSEPKSTQARMFQHSKFKKKIFRPSTKIKYEIQQDHKSQNTNNCWPFNAYISLKRTKICWSFNISKPDKYTSSPFKYVYLIFSNFRFVCTSIHLLICRSKSSSAVSGINDRHNMAFSVGRLRKF